MICPNCRIGLVSGNKKGKKGGTRLIKALTCPKCGYIRVLSKVIDSNRRNVEGNNQYSLHRVTGEEFIKRFDKVFNLKPIEVI